MREPASLQSAYAIIECGVRAAAYFLSVRDVVVVLKPLAKHTGASMSRFLASQGSRSLP